MSDDELGSLPERLRAYSADTMLCDEYAEAMQYAATEIERLRAELARCGGDVTNWVTERAADARVAAERERCAKLVEAMDTTGHDGYIETTGDLCEALAARIRRA